MSGTLIRLLRKAAGSTAAAVPGPAAGCYTDDVPRRDALLGEVYRAIDTGVPWPEAIRRPETARHGDRVAEYALVAARLREAPPDALLDVGCVLNNPIIADRIPPGCRLHFLNPSLEQVIYPEYVYFRLPLAHWSHGWRFPLVTCFSTLEHIGFDNTRYGVPERDQGWDWSRCIAEFTQNLERLTTMVAEGGLLIVTCPYGRKEFVHHPPRHGVRTAQVLHREHLAALRLSALGPALRVLTLRLDQRGWLTVDPEAPFEAYGSVGPGAAGLAVLTWERKPRR